MPIGHRKKTRCEVRRFVVIDSVWLVCATGAGEVCSSLAVLAKIASRLLDLMKVGRYQDMIDSNDWCSWGVMQLLDFAVFCIGFSAFPLWWRLALRILGRSLKYGSWEAAQWCSACCGPWPCFFWYNFVTGNPKDSADSHPTFLGTFAPICCTFQGRELMAEKFGIQVMWGIFQVRFAGSCDWIAT